MRKEMKKKYVLVSVLTILFALTISLPAGIGSGVSQTGPMPVELISFSATIKGDVILLNWKTATEVNNYGFEVQRSANSVGLTEWETIGFVEGHGNSNSPKYYSFTDSNPLNGAISYRLKQIDTDGKFEYSPVIEIESNLLTEYVLEQNYPNPFSKGSGGNPTTVISYSIPKATHVSVKVFDVLGNVIATLVNENQAIGRYKVNFDATTLSDGVYFYKMSAGEFTSIKKMLLLK